MKTLDLTQKRQLSLPVETKSVDGPTRTLVVKITTPTPDRSGDVVVPKGMDAKNFMNNPVVQFAHNYADLPIAKCTSLKVTDSAILATVEFPSEGMYPKADTVYRMYKEGFLSAWSVGFMPKEYDENEQGGYTFKQWELLEFSSVPVPANAEALTVMRSKGLDVDALFEKGVIAYKETPKADEGTKWDAGEQVKAASIDDLKIMCTWYDDSSPDVKGSYKLPHHQQAGEHPVVWAGVAAAMGALLGARGGVSIPDGDRKGVYNHLAKHYKQFAKDVPPFKAFSDEVIEKIISGEYKDADNPKDPGYTPDTKITELTVAQLKNVIDECMDAEEMENEGYDAGKAAAAALAIQKSGRTLSSKNEGMIKQAVDLLSSVLSTISTQDDGDDGKALEPSMIKRLSRALKASDQSTGLALHIIKNMRKSTTGAS